jgi:hypothetical protein
MNRQINPPDRSVTGANNTGTDGWLAGREETEPVKTAPLSRRLAEVTDSFKLAFAKVRTSRQLKLIDRTLDDTQPHGSRSGQLGALLDRLAPRTNRDEPEKYRQLNQLVDRGKLDLGNEQVLDEYLRRISLAHDNTAVAENRRFVTDLIGQGKIDLSNREVSRGYLKIAPSDGNTAAFERPGARRAINTGKLDLSNDQKVDDFLDSVGGHYTFDANGFLEGLNIPMEKIAVNEHIKQLAVNWLEDVAGRTHLDDSYPLSTEDLLVKDSRLFDILEEISASDDGKKLLVNTVNRSGKSIQEFGDLSARAEKGNIIHRQFYERLNRRSKKERAFAGKVLSDLTKYNHLIRRLGWQLPQDDKLWGEQPFRCDDCSSLSKGIDGIIGTQDIIYQVGLIDGHDVDRLYHYQYRKIDRMFRLGAADRQYFISPNLKPSGDDERANYWHEQSKYLGATAMQTCIGCASDMAGKEGLAMSDLIDENGALKDAFFENSPESLLGQFDVAGLLDHYYTPLDNVRCARIAEFLEAHRDQTNEDDGGRMLVDFIRNNLKSDDGTYDAKVIEQFRYSLGPRFVAEYQKSLNGGQEKERFYDEVFLRYRSAHDCLDAIMPRLDPDWRSHYSDAEKAYFKFISKVSSHGNHDFNYANYVDADSAGELRRATVRYFDANGPTDELIRQMLFKDMNLLRKYPELCANTAGLSDGEMALFKFCESYRVNNSNIKKWGLNPDNLPDYVNGYGLTGKLIDQILLSDIDFLRKNPDLQARLSDDKKALLEFCEQYGIDTDEIKKYQLTLDNLADYFDTNGPKSKFWQDAFASDAHNLDLIYKYYQSQNKAGRKRMGLDDKQIAVMEGYDGIDEGNDWNRPRQVFGPYIKEHYDRLTTDQIKQVSDIIVRLINSNSSELAERSGDFARELLELDIDKIPEALDRVEDIFIHNHLPYVGKNYLVFRTIYSSANLGEDFDFSFSSFNTISPVLQQATGDIRSGKLDQMLNSRDTIIVSDLLRASLGSNNRSIREYLDTLKNGQALLDQLSSGELDWDTFNQPTSLMDKDTKANYDTLSTFAWHLATIYNSTLPGKEHPYQLVHQQSDTEELSAQPNALQADFTNLTSLIKPNSRYTLADRAVRYFAHFVGIEDLVGAERYMDNVVKEADARNRRTAEYLTNTDEPKLQLGDLVKDIGGTDGYGIRYLSDIFQNGSISKEYLGNSSRSESTPLGTDMNVVLRQPRGKWAVNQITDNHGKRMLAGVHGGGLWAVLRSDQATGEDRFIVTRRDRGEIDQAVFDPNEPDWAHKREALAKLEAFATSVDGSGHYDIRTGFGMDSVDFFVTDSALVSEVTKLEIVLNGFYIPIIDRDSEELIFTPADYDKMRQQMSGLSHYRTGDYQFAPEDELELPSTNVERTTIPSTTTIIDQLPAGMAETDHKHEVINQAIKQAITSIPELNLSYKDYLDGDLTENIVEMIDTGSTGRQTNAPGPGDFDYLARLDRSILNDPTKKQRIIDALLTAFGKADEINDNTKLNQTGGLRRNEDKVGENQVDNKSVIVNGTLRLKKVSIDGLVEPVDIDITLTQKTNKVQYSTDMALADRLDNIKQQSEAKYRQVLASIIYAKQFLKAAGVYKQWRNPEAKGVGGLSGVGVENWILQHGGSFKQAARDFLAVADNYPKFEDFCVHYPVWDYGENHKGTMNKPHGNFVADSMNRAGYNRMKQALRVIVS